MMRKLFFGLLTALILAACSSDPVYHGMTPQQQENYSKAIAGEYTGTYVILYNDGGGDDKAVKIKNSQMTITDQTMHSVCFHDYPVSLPSGVPVRISNIYDKYSQFIAILLGSTESFSYLCGEIAIYWDYDAARYRQGH